MKELQVFTNVEFGEIRTLLIDDQPWFIGKNVVEVLGYDLKTHSYTKYINKYVSPKGQLLLNKETQSSSGIEFDYKLLGQRGGILLNEGGLNQLTLSSPLPEAEKFQEWICYEVLPEIRRTGGYIDKKATTQQLEQLQQKIAKLLNYKIKGDTINDVCSATGLRRKDIKHYLFDNDWIVEYNGKITNYDCRYIFIERQKDVHFTTKGLDKILKDLQPLKPVRQLINKELYRK